MYRTPERLVVPNEVKKYLSDTEGLGMIQDLNNWFVTPKWCQKFKQHRINLHKLAMEGEPWSQYHLGNMYFNGYLYSSAKECEENYQADIELGSHFLEMAARQGFVAAVDNLVVCGTGEESDRLREITKDVENEHPEFIEKWSEDENIPVILPSLFETVWERTYGKCN
jgi:hypothetical protein